MLRLGEADVEDAVGVIEHHRVELRVRVKRVAMMRAVVEVGREAREMGEGRRGGGRGDGRGRR